MTPRTPRLPKDPEVAAAEAAVAAAAALARLPAARGMHAAVAVGLTLFVYGGQTKEGSLLPEERGGSGRGGSGQTVLEQDGGEFPRVLHEEEAGVALHQPLHRLAPLQWWLGFGSRGCGCGCGCGWG